MAKQLSIGDKAPSFTCLSDEGEKISLKDFAGKNIVLYFYPKDETPGCTTEACDFRDNYKTLTKMDVVVLGVSRDTVEKHAKFKAKHKMPFTLLSDEEGSLCEKYGVWQEKSLYGRKFMGIVRTTFLIDSKGKIKKIFNKVKVNGHVDEVIEELKLI